MKKMILLAAAGLILAGGFCGAETIKGSDAKVSYIGRTAVADDGSVAFDWSATTIRLSFTGKTISMKCSDTHADYLNLWIDSQQGPRPDQVLKVNSDTTLVLFSAKKKGTHTVILQKRTEGEQGTVTVQAFETDGRFEAAPAPRSRLIEFIGDSYTCGYGTEAPGRSEPFKPETENPSLTYADILGRLFDAEAVHISHSGRGVVRNYGDYNQHENMVKLYAQTFDQHSEDAWTPTYTPDAVVIYLGTNDFSTGKQPSLESWCQRYKALLEQVRTYYGDAVPVLCLASPASELMDDYVLEAVRRSGVPNVHFASILADCYRLDDTDLGASWHPNYNGHRKIASVAAPYLSSITGWELPVKIIE